MTIPSAPQPPLGTITTAQLLADAQTKQLWLGVPTTINAQGSVLVGDITGLIQADADTLTSAQAYTDSALTGKANVSHTHVISDVTGLQAALDANAAVLPSGLIAMWKGTIVTIPAGWVICDGTNGTPDLRDKFVMGLGLSITVPGVGAGAKTKTVTSIAGGDHNHTALTGSTTLTVNQIPSHTHTVTDPGHTHAGSTSDTEPAHTHSVIIGGSTPGGVVGSASNSARNQDIGVTSGAGGLHSHNLTITTKTTGITIVAAGLDGGHTHSISASGTHTHDVTVDVTPANYALAFIMKL